MSATRELMLTRVREAIGGGAATAPPSSSYRRSGALGPAAKIDLLCERIGDYRAEVHCLGSAELTDAIVEAFVAHHAERVCIPSGLPEEWRPSGLKLIEDRELDNAALDACDGVLTGCTLAIAETGTLVLTGAAAEGRRALTLVPDLHVCVVREQQVVELVPEAMAQLADLVRTERCPVTFISGPSATSDIELNRVEGVHGPRTLVVLIVRALARRASSDARGR